MATQYKVITTLTDGTQIESGTIIIPDGGEGGTTITCNNQNVETIDLTNVTFQPRYEVESSATLNISSNNSVKWDGIKVTGQNVLGNWINAQGSLIELGMGNSDDITLTKSTDPTNGEYLQWVLSQDIKDDIAGKQDTLVSGTNIKTINGQSILGSGDLTTSGGGITEDYITISSGQTFTGGTPTQLNLGEVWANWTVISLTVENYNTSNIAASWGSSVILARDFSGHPTFTYKDTSGNTAECLVTIVSASNNVVFYPTGGDMTVTRISYIGMK